MIKPYSAALIQSVIREVRDPSMKDEVIKQNINRIDAMVRYATERFGNAKLALLPEFSIQGYDHSSSLQTAIDIAVEVPGPETDMLSQIAQRQGVYIGASVFERDKDWPGRWFNTAILIAPNGDIVLRYRKIHCGSISGGATNTSPADVYTEYVGKYGEDSLFPVVDTPLGRIGMMVCYDVFFPEVARGLALNGAEIILHPTGEPYEMVQKTWRAMKYARAVENRSFFLTANHGAYFTQTDGGYWIDDASGKAFDTPAGNELSPSMRTRGESELIDFNGHTIAEITSPGEAVVIGTIDIESLRWTRSQRRHNMLAQSSPQLYANMYAKAKLRPLDLWADSPIQTRDQTRDVLARSIAGLYDSGLYTRSMYEGD